MRSLRDQIRAQLADLKMPGSLEALDPVLSRVDGGQLAAGDAIAAVLDAQICVTTGGSRPPCAAAGCQP